MYKAVIFDLDNTLMKFEECVGSAMHEMRLAHQIHTDNETEWNAFQQRYIEHFVRHWMDYLKGKGFNDLKEIMTYTFKDALSPEHTDNYEQIGSTYWENFCQSSIFEDEAEQVLNKLYGGVKLGLISNGHGEATRGRLTKGGVFNLFDSLVISEGVGVRKPDPAIFALSLRELELEPHEVLYVGDSLTDDYVGALHAGVDFCYYNRKNKAFDEEIKPKAVINRLGELMKLIQS